MNEQANVMKTFHEADSASLCSTSKWPDELIVLSNVEINDGKPVEMVCLLFSITYSEANNFKLPYQWDKFL